MFCSSCGGQVQDGAAFCPECGAKIGGGVATQTAAVEARTAKENIESGVPFTASPSMLHHRLVHCIAEKPFMPLDVFNKVEVIREEHFCVPAYLISCNGSETFTFDVSNARSQTVVRSDGRESWEETRTREEWDNGKSSTVAVRMITIAPGNRKTVKLVQGLYGDFDAKKLVAIEKLIYPADAYMERSDIPQTMAYNEFTVPVVEKALKQKAIESLSKQKTRALQMGGANIQIQNEVVRIFLSMYRIVFKYGDKEYSLWVSGDGKKTMHTGMPVDGQIKKALDEKQKEKERALSSIPSTISFGLLDFGKWVGFILTGLGMMAMGGAGNAGNSAMVLVTMVFLVPGIALAFGCVMRRSNKLDNYNALPGKIESKYQQEVDNLSAESKNVVQQFKAKKQALRGIYEQKVTGDASAF
jgi:hypothetical protein